MPPKTTARKPSAKSAAPRKRRPSRRRKVRIKVTLSLRQCKRCGQPYNLWHRDCVRSTSPAQAAAARRNLAAARAARSKARRATLRRWWNGGKK